MESLQVMHGPCSLLSNVMCLAKQKLTAPAGNRTRGLAMGMLDFATKPRALGVMAIVMFLMFLKSAFDCCLLCCFLFSSMARRSPIHRHCTLLLSWKCAVPWQRSKDLLKLTSVILEMCLTATQRLSQTHTHATKKEVELLSAGHVVVSCQERKDRTTTCDFAKFPHPSLLMDAQVNLEGPALCN